MAKLYSLKQMHDLELVSLDPLDQIKQKIKPPGLASQKFVDELTLWKTAGYIETFEKEDFQIN